MKDSLRNKRTSKKNKHYNSESTAEKPVSTSKVSTSKDRFDIRIPEYSKTYEYLYVDTENDKRPKWERLDAIIKVAEENRNKFTVHIVDEFINSMVYLYPDKKAELEYLRPLILLQILKKIPLDERYYNDLKKLGL